MNTNIKIKPPITRSSLNFELPATLECAQPTERRGIERDEVRLMISYQHNNELVHTQFRDLAAHLQRGDVLVVNTSGTLKAAVDARRPNGQRVIVHFSTQLSEAAWAVEVRELVGQRAQRLQLAAAGEMLDFGEGNRLQLVKPYYPTVSHREHLQLWVAQPWMEGSVKAFLNRYGRPIRYYNASDPYPQAWYQTVFATEMGSAEMPSAGRAFTPQLLTRLADKGVQVLPLLLHTGVSSLEEDEQPYPEYYRLPEATAAALNKARQENRRIIAVGTTVVRTLETQTEEQGITRAGEGWTDIFITPERGLRAVSGLITGFHEPRASHLLMLEALAEREHLQLAYETALAEGYQWHEFGDLHLILP
ncbi:MAG: S-adenosylmethionine:tRNA ribosyltransferase-isomerase [Bacteroidota bacterium]